MIRGIVFTHANLGEAFCESVGSILGIQEDRIEARDAQIERRDPVFKGR